MEGSKNGIVDRDDVVDVASDMVGVGEGFGDGAAMDDEKADEMV